ncbi:MAG: type I-U CRISPR-associated protein Cas7 [Bryobacteraceae bacterium]|nr:type I-U CRISPR-associated protein Cas7 [Bryobacteraceae bacterium]
MQVSYEELLEACLDYQPGRATGRSIRTTIRFNTDGVVRPPIYVEKDKTRIYAVERRGDGAVSAQLDSPASQANRFEAILRAFREILGLPVIWLEIDGKVIDNFTAPHRVFDSIFRRAVLDGVDFPKSKIGQMLWAPRPKDMSALFRYCPNVLLFGGWDSLAKWSGARIAKVVESYVTAHHIERCCGTASRLDPLGLGRDLRVYRHREPALGWTLQPTEARGESPVEPAKVVLGNIPPSLNELGGVRAQEIIQTTIISLTALRQYSFGSPERNGAARAVLTALALFAAAVQFESGGWLRSGCQLDPLDSELLFQLTTSTGTRALPLSAEQALTLTQTATAATRRLGLEWESLQLEPSEDLIELVRRNGQNGDPEDEN